MAYSRFDKHNWHVYYNSVLSSHSPRRKHTQCVTILSSSGLIKGDTGNTEKNFYYHELVQKDGVKKAVREVMESLGCGISYEELKNKEIANIQINFDMEYEEKHLQSCLERFISDVDEEFNKKRNKK